MGQAREGPKGPRAAGSPKSAKVNYKLIGMTIPRPPTVSGFPGCLPLSFFFYSRGTRLGSKIGLKFCSPSRGGFIGLLFSIIKSRVRSDLQSEELIANNVQSARRSAQSLTSKLIHARKELKNSSQIVCRVHGGLHKP
jgi:hypothetical protein